MGKEADVEILGLVDQLLDGTALALRVAEEDLRDTLLMGKGEQRVHEMAAFPPERRSARVRGSPPPPDAYSRSHPPQTRVPPAAQRNLRRLLQH